MRLIIVKITNLDLRQIYRFLKYTNKAPADVITLNKKTINENK